MLKLIEVQNQEAREQLLKDFNTQKDTWLISDLNHKRELQNYYLKRDGYLMEDACLRARELWSKLFSRNFLNTQIVSGDFIKVVLSNWLKKQKIDWARGGTSTNTLFSYLEVFAPILNNPSASEQLIDWLSEQNSSLIKWGAWFHLSRQAWSYLQDCALVPSAWVSSLLLDESKLHWERRLIVDVGVDLTGLEVEILTQLSQSIDVMVLAPEKYWQVNYPQSLWVYNILKGEALPQLNSGQLVAANQHVDCLELNTQLVEVKHCVSQVRQWLDAGVSTEDISIYCRDPEMYWSSLSGHFQVEGIPVNKDVVCSLASFPQLSQWLATLKSHSDKLSSTDIEGWLYSSPKDFGIKYEKFRSLLTHIYEEQDLSLLPELLAFRKNTKVSNETLLRDEFIIWSLQFYPEAHDINDIEPIISRIITDSPASLSLSLSEWVSSLELFISKSEKIIQKAHPQGVAIKKLESSLWEKKSYRILMGMQASALNEIQKVNISINEVQKIGADLGIYLPVQESRRYELLVNWNLSRPAHKIVMTSAKHNFSGESESPSIVWLMNAQKYGVISQESRDETKSRWDQLQLLDPKEYFEPQFLPRLNQDKGLAEFADVSNYQPQFLSATQIKNYTNCAFKFYASSVLKLKDEPELIMDMDRMRRGRLVHKVLELIMDCGVFEKWNSENINALIEQAVMSERIPYFNSFWRFQKQKLSIEAQRFIDFERSWQRKHTKTKTVAKELAFLGEFQGLHFRGKIDRVDQAEDGRYIVIDYKSSDSGLSNYSSWIDKKEFQLYIYTLAIEMGWTELPKADCIAAVYFDLKNMNRNKGFINKDVDPLVYEIPPRTSVTADKIIELKSRCKIELERIIQKIKSGSFAPKPEDAEILCTSCEWNRLCRAPHLNH